MKKFVGPVVILFLLIALGITVSFWQVEKRPSTATTPQFASPAQTGGTVVWSDNFAEYPAGSANSASNPCNGPPDHTATCQSPPHINENGYNYWHLASSCCGPIVTGSNGYYPCTTYAYEPWGPCTTWADNDEMGPNSVVSVVTEQHTSDTTQSLKLGVSDASWDKVDAELGLPTSLFPTGETISYSVEIWPSAGLNIGQNHIVIWMPVGGQARLNAGGGWEIDGPSFVSAGTLDLTTNAWNQVVLTVNPANGEWVSITVNGVAVSGVSGVTGTGSAGGGFQMWVAAGETYDSINMYASNGYSAPFYAYFDDVSVSVGGSGGGSTTVSTQSSISTSSQSSTSTSSTATSSVVSAMEEMANWQINALGTSQDETWQGATFFEGLVALYQITGDSTYLNRLASWGNANNWTPATPYSDPDNLNAGQAFIETYILQGSSTSSEFAPTQSAVNTAMSGSNTWTYEDALYMSPPTFARVGYVTGTSTYFSSMDTWYWQTVSALQDSSTKLFWRDSTYIGQTCPNGGKMLWSRGNAWVMAGIVRILEYLPSSDPSYSQYVSLLQTMAAAVAPFQESSGYWPSCLTDPTDYSEPETSGTAGFVYAMAWGINNGILNAATYTPAVQSGWNAIVDAIQSDGALGWVQPTGSAPAASTASDSYAYGTGLALLAGSEVAKLNGIVSTSSNSVQTSATTATSGQVVWSANFEDGPNSNTIEFNLGVDPADEACTNGVASVASVASLSPPANIGEYAGYYYGGPAPSGLSVCRELATEEIPQSEALTDFYWEMWVYVPAFTPGVGWISFATFCPATSGTCEPFTIDGTKSGNLQLDVISTGQDYPSSVVFPVGQWFELSLAAHGVGTSDANLVVSMNGQPTIQVSGVSVAPAPIDSWHFGLYKDSTIGDFTIYNDDILIETLSSETETITSTSSSSTSSNTSTSSQTSSTLTTTQTLTQTSATGATPSITISPASATVGSTVSVLGSGFSASDTSCSLSGAAVGTSTCSISGDSLAATFLVANVGAGSYTITATGSPGADSATFSFQVLTSGPSITLSPASASVGSSVTVSGSGFSTSDTSCSLSGTPIGSPSCLISGGALTGSFIVANVGAGSYTITATGSPASDSASATFSLLVPSIALNPSTAQPGATVAVSGSGFYTTDTTCSLVGGGVGAQSCSISAGSLTGSFTVANAASGTYLVTVVTNGADTSLADASLQVTNSLATTTTSTLFGTSTATQFSATTTTFTLTGVLTTQSVASVTVTVTGQSTASVATASTITSFVTAASTTIQTQTTTTTHNLITGMIAPSFDADRTGEDAIGLLVALLMLVSIVLRKMFD